MFHTGAALASAFVCGGKEFTSVCASPDSRTDVAPLVGNASVRGPRIGCSSIAGCLPDLSAAMFFDALFPMVFEIATVNCSTDSDGVAAGSELDFTALLFTFVTHGATASTRTRVESGAELTACTRKVCVIPSKGVRSE